MTSSEPETISSPVKEIKSDKDGPLLTKRKTELASLDKVSPVDETDESNKKRNLGLSPIVEKDAANPVDDERKHIVGTENGDQEDEGQEGDVDADDDDDIDEEDFEGEDDSDDDDDDDDEDEDDHVNGASDVVDRKGKGIMKDDKGKGKMIEESEDDSSSYSASLSDDDSDLSDDPLAEVDLDNILPTRTRRHTIQPGVNISKARANNEDQDDK